ncbi:MAG: DUF357 domain-containing protein [Thermoplasmata archaeon]|nr:DUF357 domain-containing protein [Thermoplasmata archaeon]
MREEALREIERMEEVFSSLEGEGGTVMKLARSYFEDSKYFFERGEYLKAFEAAVISWAYVDALLHMGKARLPKDLLKNFTVEG